MNVGTEVLETFASEPIPRTVCEGSLVPRCPHHGAPQVFAPYHCQGRLIMTTVLTKPRSHPASQNPHRHRHDRRWRPTEEGAPWSEMERGVSERRGRLGPGAGRHQARCADQRASADQATMPAKSPDLKSCHRTLDQLLSHPIILTDGAPGQVWTNLSVKALNKDH